MKLLSFRTPLNVNVDVECFSYYEFQLQQCPPYELKDNCSIYFFTKIVYVTGKANAVSAEVTPPWFEIRLPKMLSSYSLSDIYNADKFRLLYLVKPCKTMHFKKETSDDGKISKLRLTRPAAGNALGQKLPLFVIRKARKLRCFKNLKHLPCCYRGKKKSWMDIDFFEEWVREQVTKYERQNQKVLLIAKNCPSNHDVVGLKAIGLCFLPPNTTSITQPMDQGVIQFLTAKFCSRMIQLIIKVIDANKPITKVNNLDAVKILALCWEDITK